jgi:hypothetical protein
MGIFFRMIGLIGVAIALARLNTASQAEYKSSVERELLENVQLNREYPTFKRLVYDLKLQRAMQMNRAMKNLLKDFLTLRY